jgi:hypothetical protein
LPSTIVSGSPALVGLVERDEVPARLKLEQVALWTEIFECEIAERELERVGLLLHERDHFVVRQMATDLEITFLPWRSRVDQAFCLESPQAKLVTQISKVIGVSPGSHLGTG